MLNIPSTIIALNEQISSSGLPVSDKLKSGTDTDELGDDIKVSNPNARTYCNNPLPGFVVHNPLHCGTRWYVIDPRGFITPISSANLNSVIQTAGISNGLIQEQCVWARQDDGNKFELITINDSRYAEAVKNTELINNKVDIRSVMPGDLVFLQSGHIGTYLGRLNLHTIHRRFIRTCNPRVLFGKQMVRINKGSGYVDYLYDTDLQILKVIEKTDIPLSTEDIVNQINQEISTNRARIHYDPKLRTGTYTHGKNIVYVSKSSKKPTHQLVEVDLPCITKEYNRAHSYSLDAVVVFEDHDGKKYMPDFSIFSRELFTSEIRANEVTVLDTHIEISDQEIRDRKIDSFAKFYIIKKIINDSESYV